MLFRSGIFCRSKNGNRLPTTELITLKNSDPFPDRASPAGAFEHWKRIVKLERRTGAWACDEYNGLKVLLHELKGDMKFHAIAALNTTRLPKKEIEYMSNTDNNAYVQYCNEQLTGVISQNAVISLLLEMRAELGTAKDNFNLIKSKNKNFLKTLKSLEDFFENALGYPSAMQELLNISEDPSTYRWRFVDFTYQSFRKDREIKLSTQLQNQTSHLAKNAILEEQSTREIFLQLSSIISTRESIQAQKKMERLTYISIGLAFASAYLAILALKSV